MTPERWRQVTTLFRRALECDRSRRPALLGEACGGDDELRREVESLLAVYEEPGDPFEAPLLAVEQPEATPTVVDEAASEDAAGASRVAGALVGETLDDKYRLEALLGRGGMGEVYRARHLQLEREVAVKVIRADQLDDTAAYDRFWREARMVARLRHPNIVTVYDYGVADGLGAYLVMEYLRGRSLRAELRERGRFDVRAGLEVAGQICAALAAAHTAGVVHRDIKPDNIFLEEAARGPSVKVLDFGLAKLVEEAGSARGAVTKRGAVLGTPAYMAPEQCRGQEADARSDVYALGCLLYEMLTGRTPFTAPTTVALLYKHVHEDPEPPAALAPGIDPALEEALLRALAKDPAKRPGTAEEFARAIGVWDVAGGTDTSSPAGATTGAGMVPTGALEGVETGSGSAPTNLRHPMTRFVGRWREIEEAREWLARTRLVSLVGPGGIGKTRLAIETAALTLGEYRDGVWLVELAAIADASLVDKAVASALGVREDGDRPVVECLGEWLHAKQLLLVLDNCEHLVDACARLAEQLLQAAPGLRVLATSREALGVAGEAVWPVPPLSVAAAGDDAFECEAATLFADRAALARPGFEMTETNAPIVAELCRRLEGLPLAIELAAARVKVLSVEQILERLSDRLSLLSGGGRTAPPRQRALRATIDWSHELLTEAERVLFRRLSVFAGGWTLEAAESVVSEDLPLTADHRPPTTLDLLSRLVDKSLVTVREQGPATRYGMLEMIREYGRERLSESGEADEVRHRHADYLQSLAEAARVEIRSGHCADWLDVLEAEHDNVRAALAWLLEHDPEGCLRLATAVTKFRLLRGYLGEARQWMETALASAPDAAASLRVVALREVGFVAATLGDLRAARAFYERGLAVARAGGDELRAQAAVVVHSLGDLSQMEGDLATARACFAEGLAIGRETENGLLAGGALNSLGEVAREERDFEAARAFYEEAIAVGRPFGNEPFLCTVLCNLGAVECERGELRTAEAHYGEMLGLARSMRSDEFISLALDGLAAVATRRGEWERAARLAGAAEALLDAVGAQRVPVDRDFRESYLVEVRRHLDEAAFEAAFVDGRARPLDF